LRGASAWMCSSGCGGSCATRATAMSSGPIISPSWKSQHGTAVISKRT
jgi:hypothetical protein